MHLKIILETSGYIRRVHIRFQIQQRENDVAIKKRETHICLIHEVQFCR